MKIGLLPLYVKLYDDKLPQLRIRLEAFYKKTADLMRSSGMEVAESPFCRISGEFFEAVNMFEKNDVDAIVTLHMAYSPSLECIDALCGTALPVVVLDTTETLEFTNEQNPDELMYNHGVHGVMDMCSMLTRRGKKYAIAAGHFDNSECIDEVCGYVRAAAAATAVKRARVGLIGGLFEGMGDFQVPYEELRGRFGIEVTDIPAQHMARYSSAVTAEETELEINKDREKYDFADNVIESEYREAVRAGLAVRKCVNEGKYSAFSINFTKMGVQSGLAVMPFLECCKAMEHGTGYAGEGDVLTAAFTGAMLKSYPDATFIEIFCPDWKNDTVFLSHMGEVNYRDAAVKPCITRAGVNYSPGGFPYAGYTRMRGGCGVYMNICRAAQDYRLVLAPACMLEYKNDSFGNAIRGWMKPETSCAEFLRQLSAAGATHHSIFVYGACIEELVHFGSLLKLETVIIGDKI